MLIGDRIIELDGDKIQGSAQMLDLIAETPPGTVMNFVVIRNANGQEQTITLPIEIAALPN